MKATGNPNINTAEYWDRIYGTEEWRKHYAATGTNEADAQPDGSKRFEYALAFVKDGDKVLDLGCGVGTFARMVKDKYPNSEVWGVDISPNVIQANKKEREDDITWLSGEIGKRTAPKNYFDVVFCGETLEHLENPKDLFLDAAEELKVGGKLLITTPNGDIIKSPEHLWIYDYKDIELFYAEGFVDLEFIYLPQPDSGKIIMAVGQKRSDDIKQHQIKHTASAKVVTLDLHDFSLENNNLYYLDQIKAILPNLKVSMFYIPFDVAYYERLLDFQRAEAVKMIKDRAGWIELIPHGLTHGKEEMIHIKGDDYDTIFAAIEDAYKTYDLPMVKGFCAPQWLYKQSLVDYLDAKGWWMAVDRNQPNAPCTKKFYEYTHSIDEPFWIGSTKEIRLHGHISGPSTNDLPNNMLNILKISPSAQFKFVSEVMG